LVGGSALLAFFLAPVLVPLFYHGGHFADVVKMTRILLLSPILFSISNAIGMILLAKKHFFSMAISPIFYNLGIILGILFFAERFGIFAAGFGAILGAILHLATRLFDFLKSKSLPIVFPKSFRILPETRRIFWLGLPRTLGFSAFQMLLIFFANLATATAAGGLAAWELARNIQSMPIALFGIALSTAAFPFLADFAAAKKSRAFSARLEKSLGHIFVFAIPAFFGMAAIAGPLIATLFERGAFDASATAMTAGILFFLAAATPFESATHLLARAFLSFENTFFPAAGKILFFLTAAISAKILLSKMGITALGAGFSIGAFLEMLFLGAFFHFRFLKFSVKKIAVKTAKIVAASVLMTIFIALFFSFFRGGGIVFSAFWRDFCRRRRVFFGGAFSQNSGNF